MVKSKKDYVYKMPLPGALCSKMMVIVYQKQQHLGRTPALKGLSKGLATCYHRNHKSPFFNSKHIAINWSPPGTTKA